MGRQAWESSLTSKRHEKELMYKGVIFDLDGVITDTARYHFIAWKELAKKLGIVIDEEFNETLKGVDRMGSLDRILALGSKQYSDTEKHKLADEKNEHYKVLIEKMNKDDLLPGAYAVLKDLQAMGIKRALASASKNAETILERLEITNLFDYVVDSAKIKNGKPAPDIFLAAQEALKLTTAECIGVEDAVVGVQAIKSAHMYAIGVGDPKVLSQADMVIPDLKAFPLGENFQKKFASAESATSSIA
jgi:beta-phosphoglucomutase